MIELAVLDIAGTTVDEHGAVYRALAEATGVSEDDVVPWMGADKREAIAALTGKTGQAVTDTFNEFRRLLAEFYELKPPVALHGVPETIDKLRLNGVKVALTTGFDRDVTTSILTTLRWEDKVDAVICTDDVPAGRPAPYMIFRAMEATGVVNVSRVLVAGDTTRDLEAGTNAGAGMVIGVLTGGQNAATLGAVRHTHILPSVADIMPHLASA
jgi:phosphonatase-like hydrolase